MKKLFFLTTLAAGALALNATAQDNTEKKEGWVLKNVGGLNLSQTSLTNWAAGGENAVAWHVYFNGSASKKQGKWSWDNGLTADFGQTYTTSNKWQKSLDKFNLNSKVGYSFAKHWNTAFLADFLTQFAPGYATATDKEKGLSYISNLLAPAYLTMSLGADYKPNDAFSLFISPVAGKMTFVMDKSLSDVGAYGVKVGDKMKSELGASLVANYTTNLLTDLNLITKLTLFTAYNHNPGYFDVNWDVMLAYKLNKYMTTTLTTNLVYDDDIKTVTDGIHTGAKVQLRQVFGLGVSYTF